MDYDWLRRVVDFHRVRLESLFNDLYLCPWVDFRSINILTCQLIDVTIYHLSVVEHTYNEAKSEVGIYRSFAPDKITK